MADSRRRAGRVLSRQTAWRRAPIARARAAANRQHPSRVTPNHFATRKRTLTIRGDILAVVRRKFVIYSLIFPHSDVALLLSRTSLHPSKATPHPSKATPHPRKATPHLRKATPHPSKVTPHPSKVTPLQRKTTLLPRKMALLPRKMTPHPRKAMPLPSKATPQLSKGA